MIPLLTYPLALLGAIAIPALVAVYFFRTRFRRHPVSSLMLWRRAHQPREGGARFQRFSLPLAFILELIVVILLFVAASDPRLAADISRKPLIVVLDDSASMLAGRRSETPQALATAELHDMCSRPDIGSIRFIIAGRRPLVLESVKPDVTLINNSLKQWKCVSPEASLERSLSLAQELGQNRCRIVVMTDRPPPQGFSTDSLLWLAFGKPFPNVGIVNAARSAGGKKERCMLEIANYSSQSAQPLLTLEFGSGIPAMKQVLNLSTGEMKRLTFDLPQNTQTLRASLAADALAADNEIFLLPKPPRKVKVSVSIKDATLRKAVQKALDSSGMTLPGGMNPQLVIADRTVNVDANPNVWILRIDAGNSLISYTGPFVIDTSHPITKGIDMDGVIWCPGITNVIAATPVITVGNIPVILDQPFPSGRHEIRMFIKLAGSTFQETPNWPILFWNLLRWRAEESEGLSDINVRAGKNVVLRLDKSVPTVNVRRPDGTDTDIKVSKKRVLIEAASLGIYHVSAGETKYSFACNLLSPGESSLRGCSSGRWGKLVDTESLKKEYISIAWILLLLALGLLTVHLALLRR